MVTTMTWLLLGHGYYYDMVTTITWLLLSLYPRMVLFAHFMTEESVYLTDGISLLVVGDGGGALLLPSLDIGLGREDVQVHLGERGGGPAREGFPLGLWSRLQTLVGETIAGDVTHTNIDTLHHQSVNTECSMLFEFSYHLEL